MRLETGYLARPLTTSDAEAIARWRYPAPYAIYSSAPADASRELLAATAAYYADPAHHYFAVDDETGDFLGFGCWGAEAQVSGFDYAKLDALDIGFGMRPDRAGQGRGSAFLTAVLAYALQAQHPTHFRATVAAFNKRSARTFLQNGFEHVAFFTSASAQAIDFVVYTRRAD